MKYSWKVSNASRILRRDKLIVHATESVFGIAASAYSLSAITEIKRVKARGSQKNFLVIVANLEQVLNLVRIDVPYRKQIIDSWPGHSTWILPDTKLAPPWLLDDNGFIGVRMTSHSQASELCQRSGPLVSTSANTSGNLPALSLTQARKYFGKVIDYYLPGELGINLRPSKIQNGVTGKLIRG